MRRGGASEEKDWGAGGAGRGGWQSKEKEEHQRLQVEKRSALDIPTIMAQIVASIWGSYKTPLGRIGEERDSYIALTFTGLEKEAGPWLTPRCFSFAD